MAKIVKFKSKLSYYLDLLDSRQKIGDLWGVLDALKNAFAHSKTKIEKDGLWLLFGQTYFEMGQYQKSSDCFFRAVYITHLRAGAFFGIARNLVCLKKFNLALDYLEATLKWDFCDEYAQAVLDWTAHIKNNMNDVLFEHKNLIDTSKNLILKQKFLDAQKILQTLKSDEQTLSLLSYCNFLNEDFSKAESLAKEVLNLDENNFLALFVLYKIYGNLNTQKQQNILKQIVLGEYNDCSSLKSVATFLSQKQMFYEALKFYEKLCKIDEFDAKNYLLCGLCLFKLKKIDDSLFYISKAMWLDSENPLYSFFYELIKTNGLDDSIKIEAKLPKNIEREKVKILLEIFFNGKFNEEIKKSYYLIRDIIWSYSLKDLSLTQNASNAICNSKNQKALSVFNNLLLSNSLSKNQKFLMVKSALFSSNYYLISFVCDFSYSSFKLKKNEMQKFKNKNFREGVCDAVCYAECFYPKMMLLKKIFKKAQEQQYSQFLKNMPHNVVACFLLKDFAEIFEKACLFFETDKSFIKNLCKANSEVSGEQNFKE